MDNDYISQQQKFTKGTKETGQVKVVRDPRVLVQTDHHSTAAKTLRKTSIGWNKSIIEDKNEYFKLKEDKNHTKNYIKPPELAEQPSQDKK